MGCSPFYDLSRYWRLRALGRGLGSSLSLASRSQSVAGRCSVSESVLWFAALKLCIRTISSSRLPCLALPWRPQRWATSGSMAWRRCSATSTAASTAHTWPNGSSSPSGARPSTSSPCGCRKRFDPHAHLHRLTRTLDFWNFMEIWGFCRLFWSWLLLDVLVSGFDLGVRFSVPTWYVLGSVVFLELREFSGLDCFCSVGSLFYWWSSRGSGFFSFVMECLGL